jgi:hypothetical protein
MIIALLVALAIGVMIGLKASKPRLITKVETVEKTIVEIDTVLIPTTRTVTLTKYVPRTVYSTPDTIKEFVMVGKKNFMDTVRIDETMKIMYDIEVLGELNSLSLGYIDTRPDKQITRVITNYESPKGLYVGGSVGINNLSVGAQYNQGKNVYGLSYNIVNPIQSQSISLSYFRRIY